MTAVATSQTELIPGYRLLTRLGQGGFGEVWKAEAPGGLFKAIKIVHGSIHGLGEADAPARQELKALERVKSVRHPFILSVERYDIVHGQLVIVTELADKNLADRFQECRAQGLPGIPYQELMRYMEETAEALDLMNKEYQLQHLDIKPQNLFLLHNHIKVADFGLVKDLEGMRAQMTSGITAGYAPPETFEGLLSPYCDQYSLGIVYQELLTGQLPFAGGNPRQLMMQHVTQPPNLEPLPPCDRATIGRALAKKPEDRHPSCGALVEALREGRLGSSPVPIILPAAPAVPPREVPRTPPAAAAPADLEESTIFLGAAQRTPAADAPVVVPAKAEPVPVAQASPEPPEIPEPPEVTGEWLLFPAVIVGLGGTGRVVLRGLRKILCKRWGADGLANVRLLLIDTDPDDLLLATQGDHDTSLERGETVLARLQRPSQYLKPGRERQEMEKWLDPELLRRLPREQTTPNGIRILGRLAFKTNEAAFVSRLGAELTAALQKESLAPVAERTGLGLRTNRPRVYVVASLGGGTGGGMFADVGHAAGELLGRMGYRQPDVQGVLLLPAVERAAEKARATANTFAGLTEVNYFSARTKKSRPPFSRCMFLPVPKGEKAESLHEAATLASEFLLRELATPLARVADEERRRRIASEQSPVALPSYQTFGAYWFAVPRGLLLQRVARRLCNRLVQGWRADHGAGLDREIKAWIAQQVTQSQLTPEELTTALVEEAARIQQRPPEEEIDAALAAFGNNQGNDLAKNPGKAAVLFGAIDQLVGAPDGNLASGSTALGAILQKAIGTLSSRLEERLPPLALHALAEPYFRLLGMADKVQASLTEAFAELARTYRTEGEQLARKAAGLFGERTALLAVLQKGSFWGWQRKNRAAAELIESLRAYGKTRWQAMTQYALSAVYQDLDNNLQKYRRNVDCCRKRIAAFLKNLEDAGAADTNVDLGLGQYLLPAGCRSLDSATEQILAGLGEEELKEINAQVRRLIGRALEAHVHVCTAPETFFKGLQEAVHREVTGFAEAPLGRAHAAEVYVTQRGEEDAAVQELAGAFDQAAPELGGTQIAPEDQLNLIAVPAGPEGERFRRLVQQALPDQALIPAASTDDIVFYREILRMPLTALPQMRDTAQQVYHQFLTSEAITPHCRTDVGDWQMPPG
jgi:eukaryotic-like serine/threonine-protein kinase